MVKALGEVAVSHDKVLTQDLRWDNFPTATCKESGGGDIGWGGSSTLFTEEAGAGVVSLPFNLPLVAFRGDRSAL